MKKIPASIHLTYKTEELPEQYTRFYDSMKQHHPDWNMVIYDDTRARAVIKDFSPEVLALYDGFTHPVQRTDLFRIIVVYLYGGFYLDLDMLCLKSLEELRSNSVVLGEERFLSKEEAALQGSPYQSRVANYMFGAASGHPFWLDVIHEMLNRASRKVETEEDILDTTGPGLLTDVYHRVKNDYSDITLLLNRDRVCMKWCEVISCHFGEYAAHYHLGSWRWQ